MSNGLSVTNVVAAKELAALLLQEGLWKAAVDPTTFKSYYFHKGTKERVWSLEEHIRKLLQGGQTASGVHQLYRANPSGDAASSSPARRVIRQSATTVSTALSNNHREGGGTAQPPSSSSAATAAAIESGDVISASVAVVPTTTTTSTPPPQGHTVDGATVVPATATTKTDIRPSSTTTTTTSTGSASVPPAVADHAPMSTLAATAPPAAEVTGSESPVGVSRPRHNRTAASASTPPRTVVASTSSSSLSPASSREVGSHQLLRVAVGVPLAHVWSVRSEFLRAASSSSSSSHQRATDGTLSAQRYSSLLMNVPFLLQRYAPQMASNLPNVLLGALAHPPPPSTTTTTAVAVPPHRFLAVAVVQQQTKKQSSSSSEASRSIVEVRGLCEVAFTSAPPQCVVRQLVAVPLVDAATMPPSHVTAASKVATNHQHTIVLDHPILRRLPNDAESGALFLWSSAATVTLPTRGGSATARLTLSFHGALRIVTPMAMAVPWSVVRFQPQAAADVEAATSSLVSPQRRVAEEGAGFVPLSVAENSTLFASEEVAWCGGALRDLERVAETLTSATDVSKSGGWRTPHRNQPSSQQDHSARQLDASSPPPPPTNGMKSSSPSILVLRDLLDDATMKRTERPPLLRSPGPGMADRDGRHPTSAAKRSSKVTTTTVQQILQSAAYRKGHFLQQQQQQRQPHTAHHRKAGTVRTFGAEGDPLRPSASPSLLYRRESLYVQTTPRPGAMRAGAFDQPTWMDRRATTTTPPGGRSSCPPSIVAVHPYGQRPQSSGPSSRNMTSKRSVTRSGGNNTADEEEDSSQMVVSLEDAELFEALMQQLDALEESQL